MNRSLAALCVVSLAELGVLSLATPALAGVTYSNDNRFVQAVNSFGQNSAKVPPVPFGDFHQSAQTDTSRTEGVCSSSALHDSAMSPAGMAGSGTIGAHSQTLTSSSLVFAASGNTRFDVSFTPDEKSTIDLSGSINGSPGASTILVQLKLGATTLFTTSTPGGFQYQAPLAQNQTYRLIVSCAANTLLAWTGTPASSDASASFMFAADLTKFCAGDLNLDGVVDDIDFTVFVPAYNILDCADGAMPAGCPADLNRDGVVDDIDFTLFVPAYNELICP